MEEKRVSAAQRKATDKYLEKFDEIRIRIPKGQKDTVKAHAEGRGESVNGFIGRAISETIERDRNTGSRIAQQSREHGSTARVVSNQLESEKATVEAANPPCAEQDKAEAWEQLQEIFRTVPANLDRDVSREERLNSEAVQRDNGDFVASGAETEGV